VQLRHINGISLPVICSGHTSVLYILPGCGKHAMLCIIIPPTGIRGVDITDASSRHCVSISGAQAGQRKTRWSPEGGI